MALILFAPNRKIACSDNLLHNSKKKPRSSELIIGVDTIPPWIHGDGQAGNFFHSCIDSLRITIKKQHNFHQIPVPPASAEKLIWPSCKKEKGVGKGNNNNCPSYQCLYHLPAGAAPNNSACFGSRCLLQLLCTGLTAPINSVLFLWLRVAVIWVYECEICLALPPLHEWFGLESVIIFGQRERDAARRQTEQTLWIFIFFRWKAVVFMCSCKTEKILVSAAGIIY